MDDCKMYLRISLKTVILIMVLILPLIFRKIAQTPLLVLGALGSSTILVLILAFHVEARELPSYHQTREIMNKSLLHHCSKSTEAQRRKNRMEVVMHNHHEIDDEPKIYCNIVKIILVFVLFLWSSNNPITNSNKENK